MIYGGAINPWEVASTGGASLETRKKVLMQEVPFQKSSYSHQRHQNLALKAVIPVTNMGSLKHLISVCSQVPPLKCLKKENLERLELPTQVQCLQG